LNVVTRLIATSYIILSSPCEEQTRQNPSDVNIM
jgi:hypothetical protein